MSDNKVSTISQLNQDDVVLIGVQSDFNSSYLRGTAKAPEKIRQALYCGSANLSSELGVSLTKNPRFKVSDDDLKADDIESYLALSDLITPILNQGAKPLTLGGDHAITFPIVKAIADKYGPVNILHFDAHPDLYQEYDGNPYSHACPFARIMQNGLAKRLVQLGIRTLNQHQKSQADKYAVEVNEMRDFDLKNFKPEFDGPVYLSFDMDALDPAFAPGVSHIEPGGLSVRDVLGIIQNIENPIIGADIVEYNPEKDINEITAMVAAKLLKEIAGKMLS